MYKYSENPIEFKDYNGIKESKFSIQEKKIQAIKDYIDIHYCDAINLDFLAAKFSVTPNFISLHIKKEYQITPKKYMLSLRLRDAKIMLLDTNLDIREIAHKVGYKNENVFKSYFQKHIGISPEQFRKARKDF